MMGQAGATRPAAPSLTLLKPMERHGAFAERHAEKAPLPQHERILAIVPAIEQAYDVGV